MATGMGRPVWRQNLGWLLQNPTGSTPNAEGSPRVTKGSNASPTCDSSSSVLVANQFTLGKTFTTKEDAVKAVREAIANGQQPSRKVAKKKALTEYGEASQRKAPKSIVHRVACLAKACENIHM